MLQYFGLIVLAVTALGGVIAYNVKKHDYRRAIGVLPTSHSEAEAEEAAVPA